MQAVAWYEQTVRAHLSQAGADKTVQVGDDAPAELAAIRENLAPHLLVTAQKIYSTGT